MISKKKRHKVYKYALENLIGDELTELGHTGICDYLEDGLDHFGYHAQVKDFKEFMAYKPNKDISMDSGWWRFNQKGFDKRKRILQTCIDLTQ